MFSKKKKTVLLSTIILSLWSTMAMAAKNATLSSTISGWPLPLFIVGLIIFRKKIFHGHDIPQIEPNEQVKPSPKKEPVEKQATNSKPKKSPVKKVASTKENVAKDTSNKVIDLTEGNEQCQASTSKGARCKRTNTLESTTLKIGNKTYQVIVCSQHKNNKLKPYPKLIK